MDLQTLQDLANDVCVARLELASLEEQKEAFLAAVPQLVELNAQIEEAANRKRELSDKMLECMKESELKSWKTDKANFARATRKTAEFNPMVKKQIEARLKDGEQIENWNLKVIEFISITTVK
jgi:hypothetical protein